MKKLFILAAAIIALASCQKEQATYVEDGSIKFANVETRTVITDLGVLKTDGFNVLGFANDDKLFDSEKATSKGTWWEMTTKKYWADNTTYNFFAVWPIDYKFTPTDKNVASAYFTFANTGETDLVLAGRKVITNDNGTERGAAELVFKHALSRVRFQFKNAYSSETLGNDTKFYVDVTDLALIGEGKSGIVTIETDDSTYTNKPDANGNITYNTSNAKITWTLDNEATKSNINYMSNNENFSNTNIEQTSSATTDYKYIIPTLTEGGEIYKLACKIKIHDGKNTIREFDYTGVNEETGAKAPITITTDKTNSLTHEMGKSYTYTMNITTDLNEIRFTVAVEEWTNGNGDGEEIDFPGDN